VGIDLYEFIGGFEMKKRSKIISFVILLLCVLVAAAGCGGKDNSSDESGKKKYIVGTDAAYAPMEYMNDKGEIVGYDIDFVKALAEEAGIEVEFRNVSWDPLFDAVKNSEVDFAVSSISITDKRKESHDFSDPYFTAYQLILVPEDSDITSFEDLKGKKVSVQISTTGHEVVKGLLGETSPDILAFETMPLAISEMVNGGADACVGDSPVIREYIKNNPNVKFRTIRDSSFQDEYYGLMVKKGNQELLDLLNNGIKKLKEKGKLEEIFGAIE
jgi:polar amino acid transport system substrate-binding protein